MDTEVKSYTIYEIWNDNTWDVGSYLFSNKIRYEVAATNSPYKIPSQLKNIKDGQWLIYNAALPSDAATYIALALPDVVVKLNQKDK